MKNFIASAAQRLWLLLLAAVLTGTLATSCSKGTDYVDYAPIDDALIQKYLAANAITTAKKQPSGLYFVPGVTNASAKLATVGTNVSVLFTATTLDGTVFDGSSLRNNVALSFVLGRVSGLPGLQEGISLMHLGDKATLVIPSGLAYGGSEVTGPTSIKVPANSVVRFDVELVDFNFAATDDALIVQYLAANNITNFQKTASGLYYVPGTLNPTGAQAVAGKTASVLYTGKLLNGTVFDATSLRNNVPFSFVVGNGQVIAGWDEGIALMRKGEKSQLLIPSALGYGPNGSGSAIPGNSVIRFDVEIADVK